MSTFMEPVKHAVTIERKLEFEVRDWKTLVLFALLFASSSWRLRAL